MALSRRQPLSLRLRAGTGALSLPAARPAISLAEYTRDHLQREYHTVKTCAPLCTDSCVHQTAMADDVREKPPEALPYFLPATHGVNKALAWLFLKPATRRLFSKAALWVLKVQ